MTYPLVERFVSINGEGPHAGYMALFLRFAGCNLTCSYCDTAWANAPDCPVEQVTQADLLENVRAAGVHHVTVTGGEPLLVPGMAALLQALSHADNVQVEVETNGSVDVSPFLRTAPRVSFTMDYKLPLSGMEAHMCLANLDLLRAQDSLKFVCGGARDLQRVKDLLDKHRLQERCGVYISPVFGQIEAKDLVAFIIREKLANVRLQLQLHKFIWPPEQRGV